MTITEFIVALLLLFGVAIRLLSTFGILRFGDVYLRMHASTKASTLGLFFILGATAVYFADPLITIKMIALFVIYFFTAPIGTQVLAHGAYVSGVPMVKETRIDQLAEDVAKSTAASVDGESTLT
jgi:multicomponent Na+:H+ antiporter subunit G